MDPAQKEQFKRDLHQAAERLLLRAPCTHGKYEPHDACEGGRAMSYEDLMQFLLEEALKQGLAGVKGVGFTINLVREA